MSKNNYLINIHLKSDLCTSSGESLGSFIDSDVCYDKYGIPYIPAKRIKGLLREAALEYCDWSGEDKEIIEKIFGKEGNRNPGLLEIDNAHISHYNRITNIIDSVPKEFERYLTRQRLVNVFTYVRYQTAVNEETGASKDNSLRSTRVVKSGITFKAPIKIENCDSAKIELLEKITKLIMHMGINRTRGFGEVQCVFEKDKSLNDYIEETEITQVSGSDEIKQLKLILKADSELMISKQNSEISQKYIPGSNILGSIAREYIKANNITDFENIPEEFVHLFLDGSVKYFNAYVSNKEGKEFYPIPFSYSKVKNTDDRFYNKMFEINEEGIQLSSITDKFVTLDNENYIQDVKMSENYHHQRPKDKSIGHVIMGKDGGTLYQFNAISEGQYFLAIIEGKEKDLNVLKKYVTKFRVGKSKTTEYGALNLVGKPKLEEINNDTKTYENFAVILTSDTILLDSETAASTTNKDKFVDKIKSLIGNENIELQRAFINYEKVSGYNVMWNMPKEQLEAFKAGSVFVFKAPSGAKCKENYSVGQRQCEGYGRLKIIDLSNKNENLDLKTYEEQKQHMEINAKLMPIYNILYASINNVINDDIVESAINQFATKKYKINNSTIGRMKLMLQQSKDLDAFENNINTIKDIKKLRNVTKVIDNFKKELPELVAVKDLTTLITKVKDDENGIKKETLDNYMKEYIKQCLISIKIAGGVEE